ncbi:MAG: hypothetical protein ACK46O_02510 [Flavobacteriia bacterium]|jgi:uncharacterized protein YgfB (UPF0149 family)
MKIGKKMTTRELNILKLLRSFLQNESDYRTLNDRWVKLYIEDDEDTVFEYEDTLSEIGEFIYWGMDLEPSKEEKQYGLISPEELKIKIKRALEKYPNLEKYTC